ncbi:hypothetical protein GW7_08979 [Heterocephalus glaber]|uniref:Uncharacterized protein n=1 Tax=Heterocephalus glaber TaxID=10181 RepID=G5BSD3_HETGA|nr:hypothetical protein GW7_08979 [Heterocephalus glaber]
MVLTVRSLPPSHDVTTTVDTYCASALPLTILRAEQRANPEEKPYVVSKDSLMELGLNFPLQCPVLPLLCSRNLELPRPHPRHPLNPEQGSRSFT